MADIITAAYAQQTVTSLADVAPQMLAACISAASDSVRRFCRRNFIPVRYAEIHDAGRLPVLMLRETPIISVNSVTLYPDSSNPIVLSPDQLDIRSAIGRISIKPQIAAGFPMFPFTAGQGLCGWAAPAAWPCDAIEVDYNAGFGFQTQSTAPISAGDAAAVPAAMSGTLPTDPTGEWAIAAGTILTLDAGNVNMETVTVLSATTTSFTAQFANPHAAGCGILGRQIPNDVQFACALLAANMINQPDLTKQRESMGKTVGYEYVLRHGDVYFTPEIRNLLVHYQDAMV